jgi:hypothetical protein
MKKRGIISDYLPWLLIGIAVLAILSLSVYFLREQGSSLIESIKNLVRGR